MFELSPIGFGNSVKINQYFDEMWRVHVGKVIQETGSKLEIKNLKSMSMFPFFPDETVATRKATDRFLFDATNTAESEPQ